MQDETKARLQALLDTLNEAYEQTPAEERVEWVRVLDSWTLLRQMIAQGRPVPEWLLVEMRAALPVPLGIEATETETG